MYKVLLCRTALQCCVTFCCMVLHSFLCPCFSISCALCTIIEIEPNLQTGFVKKSSGHVANSIGVSTFHVPGALLWTKFGTGSLKTGKVEASETLACWCLSVLWTAIPEFN